MHHATTVLVISFFYPAFEEHGGREFSCQRRQTIGAHTHNSDDTPDHTIDGGGMTARNTDIIIMFIGQTNTEEISPNVSLFRRARTKI